MTAEEIQCPIWKMEMMIKKSGAHFDSLTNIDDDVGACLFGWPCVCVCRQQQQQQGVMPSSVHNGSGCSCRCATGNFLFFSSFLHGSIVGGHRWLGLLLPLLLSNVREECRPHYPTERDRRPYGFLVLSRWK